MMRKDLVSVVITTCRREYKLLKEAIESVRSQTYRDIELIVVDDNGAGSPIQQDVEAALKPHQDIIYLVNATNSGAQVSRNRGILASHGEFVAFLDDDDIWAPDKIEKQMRLMQNESLDLVFCNGYRFYNNDLNDTKLYQVNFIGDRELDFATELRQDHIGSTSIPLMRKECLAQTGLFDVNMPARQDFDMWIRFCKYFRVKGINEPLFYYRYHSGERITSSYKKELRSYRLLLRKYAEDFAKDKVAKSNMLFTLCITCAKSRHAPSAIAYGVRAFICSPKSVIRTISNHRHKIAQF